MALDGILEKLYSRRRFGIRPGIDRVGNLLDRLGNPERCFSSIHVVGTNGKGSTSAFLSAILEAGGHSTALFTSPHLISFNERFRINGCEVESGQLSLLLKKVLSSAPEEATFFEIVTALAALLFAENSVEIAVMEAGMGGRSDATAVLPGLLTLITPISLDHCDYLGATIEDITREKTAIAEPGTPVITASQTLEALTIIREHSMNVKTPLYVSGADFSAAWNSQGLLDYCGIHAKIFNLAPGIPGAYQAGNAALALAASEILCGLGIRISEEAMRTGLAKANWPGRMEIIPGEPKLMLDGAHNPAGASALAEALSACRYNRLLMVTGVMADKDAKEIIRPLAGRVSRAYCVSPALDRAMDYRTLAGITSSLGIESRACGTVANGIAAAKADAGPGDLILVCGSLFTVGEAKACLTGKKFEGIRG